MKEAIESKYYPPVAYLLLISPSAPLAESDGIDPWEDDDDDL